MFARSIRYAFFLAVASCSSYASAAVIDGFAAMGASETDGNGFSGSWVPYLATDRGFNFGGAGNPYNVAKGGATSATLLTQGQHTKTANQISLGNVDVAFLTIGGNDFGAVGSAIASGALSGSDLADAQTYVLQNTETAIDTVLAAHPTGMIVSSLPDALLQPGGRAIFDTPAEIARGVAAIDGYNAQLKAMVLGKGQVFVDLAGAMRDMNLNAPLIVGGVTIDLVGKNASDPRYFFTDDLHPGAVGNGVFANLMLTAVNIGYGTNYALLTDLQILTRAGLASSYTGQTSALDYGKYVYTPVPEPSTIALGFIGAAALLVLNRRRARRCAA